MAKNGQILYGKKSFVAAVIFNRIPENRIIKTKMLQKKSLALSKPWTFTANLNRKGRWYDVIMSRGYTIFSTLVFLDWE